MWRIAKSLNKLGQPEEALTYLNKVIGVQRDWFILKEMADCYWQINNNSEAISYVALAVLTDDPVNVKVNLYYLIYNILKDSSPLIALKHAKLYLAIKLENGGLIAEDIEDLDIDKEDLDINELEREIKDYWLNI